MTTHILLQFTGITIAYLCVMLLLPWLMFRRILQGRRVAEQFLLCYTFGNFYIINIVFLLQLLHVSNWLTLVLLTVLLSLWIWSKVERVRLRDKAKTAGNYVRKWLQGTLGGKTIFQNLRAFLGKKLKSFCRLLSVYVVNKPLQWGLLAILFAGIFWVYGRQLLISYGYSASDIPVHLMWINEMSRGNLFSDGVYPFGFHCVIYYLHTVFRVDTYVILCQFFLVQVVFAHLVLLAVLKMCCKTKYLPYLGTIVYAVANFWRISTYSRYFSTLPQEYGMIFVLPSIYFLFVFFQRKKEELKEKETYLQLGAFAMAFSLTLAIHFYGTMIAGLCCIGIAFGYIFRFLRKPYFSRIMVTGIISIFLAVLPMGVAFLGGTPLQGSLGWGMSVINGGSGESQDESTEDQENTNVDLSEESGAQGGAQETEGGQTTTEEQETGEGQNMSGQSGDEEETNISGQQTTNEQVQPEKSLQERLQELGGKLKSLPAMMAQQIKEFIINLEDVRFGSLILAVFPALVLLGLLLCIFRQTNYGAMLISTGFCMLFLSILLCAGMLGLPPLMDPARCSIYFAYLLPVAGTFLGDGILSLVFFFPILRIPRNVVSFVLTGAVLVVSVQNHWIKSSDFGSQFVTNEAITCMDNIIYENQDSTWTIVSANDETQMGLDHGWHYESISFLREMEYLRTDTKITIPTKNVYIFIEKVPVDYAVAYAGSGQSISEKGAVQPLPNVGGIGMYQGENRWIVMSRLYYWAQAFHAQYPNEMQVYYETDKFVCYKVEQNMYHLYNFAIDYGYNQILNEDVEN